MVDTSTEAVTKLLDGVTPGPWDAEYDDYGEEIWFGGEGCGTWTVGPCFIGGDGHDPDLARIMDADAHFIAAARDLVPALLAERDAMKAEIERLKSQPITVQDAAKVMLDWWLQLEPDTCAIVAEAKRVMGVMSALSDHSDNGFAAFGAAMRAITEGRE